MIVMADGREAVRMQNRDTVGLSGATPVLFLILFLIGQLPCMVSFRFRRIFRKLVEFNSFLTVRRSLKTVVTEKCRSPLHFESKQTHTARNRRLINSSILFKIN